MPIGDNVQHLVCGCNSGWASILPKPPCPYHAPQAYNGLCQCRGPLDPHPFHADAYKLPAFQPVDDYQGRHRKTD